MDYLVQSIVAMAESRQEIVSREWGARAPTVKYALFLENGYPMNTFTALPMRRFGIWYWVVLCNFSRGDTFLLLKDFVTKMNFLASYGWTVPWAEIEEEYPANGERPILKSDKLLRLFIDIPEKLSNDYPDLRLFDEDILEVEALDYWRLDYDTLEFDECPKKPFDH